MSGTQRDQERTQGARIAYEPLNFHGHTHWNVGQQVIGSTLKLYGGAVIIVAEQVITPYSNLEYALVESVATRTGRTLPDRLAPQPGTLLVPERLERFVALEVLTAIELLDPSQ
jgi:hypothetical protein